MNTAPHRLGVAICTYNSADVILDCLESLLASTDVILTVVIADNASTDGTPDILRRWAATRNWEVPTDCPFEIARVPESSRINLESGIVTGSLHKMTLLETGLNAGFAAGVNAALTILARDLALNRFWILNPDSMVPPSTAAAFASEAEPSGGFALMGGRVLYCDGTERIQIDGGTINWYTGVTSNINQGIRHSDALIPELAKIDFITGASMVVSRHFYELAGPMPEDYFLYYEEVDWALRRKNLPLSYCPSGLVYHRAGTSIGSQTLNRPASSFSIYFKHRGRLRFLRKHHPIGIPTALVYSFAKAIQLIAKGYPTEAITLLSASLGLPPSKRIRARLSPEAQKRAFLSPRS